MKSVSSLQSGARSACLPFLYHTKTLSPLFLQNQARSRLPRPIYRYYASQGAKYKDAEIQPSTEEDRSTWTPEEIAAQEAQDLEDLERARLREETRRKYAEEVASYPSYKEWAASKEISQRSFRSSLQSRDTRSNFPESNIDQFEPEVELVDERREEQSESFEDDEPLDYNEQEERQELDMTSYRPGAPPKESTITDSERQAFNRIFSDIFNKLKDKGQDTKSPAREELSPQRINASGARRDLSDIMSGAVAEAAEKKVARKNPVTFKFLGDGEDPVAIEEKMRLEIEKYPPSLRPAASRALASVARRDVLDLGGQRSESKEQLDQVNKLEHLRSPERKRVEQLMRDAKTDFELWTVLEEEVFSMVANLGLQNDGESDVPTNSSHQLEILGPLYPSHLLLALRLLSTSFTTPSPLTLTILPRIKSLGIISQVLGASTALYNELLRIQWLRYDNYKGVLDLLSEISNSGLEFDRETLDVVQGIRMRERMNRREEREVVRELFRSKYAPFRAAFRGWESRIKEDVGGRDREFERGLTWAAGVNVPADYEESRYE